MPPSPRTEPTLLDRLRGVAARQLERLPIALPLSPIRIDGQTLDPTLRTVLALRPPRGRERMILEAPIAARARLRREALSIEGTPPPVASVREVAVRGAEGVLAARCYTPEASGAAPPLLVYLHGGGFSQGDLDTHDAPCRRLCRHAGQVVLSVAYRLAPEHRFPAPAEDAVAAFRWAQDHAAELGADPARVAVGGDSAGGNLAAVVAQQTRAERPPAAQLLIYPSTDTPTDRPSRHLFDGFFLSDAEREAYHQVHTEGTGADPRDPRLSPLHADDLSGLAPALVVTAGFDVLRDEGEAYAEALRAAGTPVEAVREAALVHGFIHLTAVSREAHRATVDLARRWGALVASSASDVSSP